MLMEKWKEVYFSFSVILFLWFAALFCLIFAYPLCVCILLETEEDKKDLPASDPDSSESQSVAVSSQSESTDTEEKVKQNTKEKETDTASVELVEANEVVKTDVEKNAQTETESNKVPNISESNETASNLDSNQVKEMLTKEKESSENNVISSVENVSEKVIEEKGKTKKVEKLEKLKRKNVTESTALQSPQSPTSPVFDPSDFSYEEDVMPGKFENLIKTFGKNSTGNSMLLPHCSQNRF